jgi:signal transduction histidine kinase/CheY-like chemotaxis protein
MVAFVIEALFAVVFGQAALGYLAGRDEVQRAVMLMFSAMAALFALDLLRRTLGPPPLAVRDLAVAAIFAQPYLTLRLIALLRPVPRRLLWSALLAYVASAAPLVLSPPPAPRTVTLGAIGVYAVIGAVATGFLVKDARRRAGSSQARLWLAALGTGLMVTALALLAPSVLRPNLAAVLIVVSRAVALGAGLAYLSAFMPPRWLRRMWSGSAAYAAGRELLYATREERPETTWQRYAETVRRLSGADGVAVLAAAGNRPVVERAVSGFAPGPPDGCTAEDMHALLHAAQPVTVAKARHAPPVAVSYARRGGGRYVRAVQVPLRSGDQAALLFVNRYRSLFAEDDARLLADLGGQVAIVAERQHLTERLEASVAALGSANDAKSDFLASMSHELRTPLNAIIGFSDLMHGEPRRDGCHLVPPDWIHNVLSSGQHLLRLVNDILDIAKVESGRLELHRQDVPLRRAVGEVTAALGPLADRKHLHLAVRIPAVAVNVDPIRMRQILDNLLSNAIKFTPEDGTITVEAAAEGGGLVLSVTDTGPGIAAADHERIFEEFRQVGDAGSRLAGTGLGLALTRRLVEVHGGQVEVRSTPGAGCAFTVSLPGPVRELSTEDPVPLGGCGVLIIEDDPHAAHLLRTYLASAGYAVNLAVSGEAGLAAAKAEPPDAILLDLHLPGMDGWQVLHSIQADPALRDVPIFIVSVIDERLAGQAVGAVDYFVKPVNRSRLLARLAEHVLAGAATPPPRVLVVDDDAAWLALVAADLRHAGADVTAVTDPLHALELAHSHAFDLVVTDLAIPRLDGFALVNSLRTDPATQHVPVLVMTGHDLSDAQRSRLDGKALTVLTKDSDTCAQLRAFLAGVTRAATPERAA